MSNAFQAISACRMTICSAQAYRRTALLTRSSAQLALLKKKKHKSIYLAWPLQDAYSTTVLGGAAWTTLECWHHPLNAAS